MISLSYLYDSESLVALAPALRQAAIWGGSSALATKLTSGDNRNHLRPEAKKKEKRKILKNMAISGLLGGVAGAAGSML